MKKDKKELIIKDFMLGLALFTNAIMVSGYIGILTGEIVVPVRVEILFFFGSMICVLLSITLGLIYTIFAFSNLFKFKKEKLWLRKLDCGHSRPTNIAFICKNYEKPKIGDPCYCRECFKETTIISVEEINNE